MVWLGGKTNGVGEKEIVVIEIEMQDGKALKLPW